MLLYLCLLWAGSPSLSSTDSYTKSVRPDAVATLECPGAAGDVTWSRFINGNRVALVTVRNGQELRHDKRYGSRADNALVISRVRDSDSAWYFCNGKQTAYLQVTTEPDAPQDGPGSDPGTEPDREADAAGHADAGDRQPSDLWKIPVGAAIGASVVLLAFLAFLAPRLCPVGRAQRGAGPESTATEVIYEEIGGEEEGGGGGGGGRPRTESEVESPYYWSTVAETPSGPATPDPGLYSAVNKPKAGGRRPEECVYSLAQSPRRTGDVC